MVVTWKGVHREFEAWYRADYQRLVNAVALTVGDSVLAADAVAEAFTRALARWNRVGSMQHRSGWVFRTAVNVAKRSLRRGAQ